MHIKSYFNELATQVCSRPLPELSTHDALNNWRNKRVAQFNQAIGIDTYLKHERSPLNTQITGSFNRNGYTVETLYYESLPGMFVAANLYLPKLKEAPSPAIVYLNGHALKQKEEYQSHAQQLVRLGFAVLIVDTIQLGENMGYHHGTYRYGWFHWISKGYTPVAAEVWNGIRAIDLLSERKEVDSDRIGVTGNSGGGSITWWLACSDERVKALAPSCGTGTTSSHIRDNTIDTHCDCFFPNNPYGWSLTEMYALVAPRPVLIAASSQDLYFTKDSIHGVHEKLKRFYGGVGLEERVGLAEFEGPHGYDTHNRIEIAEWFLQYLTGREMTVEDKAIFHMEYNRESGEVLDVFKQGLPADDESSTVQDWFIPVLTARHVRTEAERDVQKRKLIESLKSETFAFFPSEPVAPNLERFHRYQSKDRWYEHVRYTSEPGWELQGALSGSLESASNGAKPTAVYLRGAENYYELSSQGLLGDLSPSWLRARLDPRGSGDSAWAPQFGIHLRRSAMLLGRTLPAMMIWDTLRGIAALRTMPEVDPDRIVLAARREMAAVALYAALLDERVYALVLEDPIDTLNKPDEGEGLPVELLNVLRHTDLPHTAALLHPMPLIFVQKRPEAYRFTEQQYQLLGLQGGTWRVQKPGGILEQLIRRGRDS